MYNTSSVINTKSALVQNSIGNGVIAILMIKYYLYINVKSLVEN